MSYSSTGDNNPRNKYSLKLLGVDKDLIGEEDYEVVTTNYGWNGDNPHNLNFTRRILAAEFYNATRAHPRYNSSAWADLEKHPDPTRKIVAFLDVDTCVEFNYPSYGDKWWHNIEENYRNNTHNYRSVLDESCQYIIKAATSPALLANSDSRLVLLDCSGAKFIYLRNVCKHNRSAYENNDQVITAYMSVMRHQSADKIGLPPPAVKPIDLTAIERWHIQTCEKRKYLFSFQGQKKGKIRETLLQFKQYDDMYINIKKQFRYARDLLKGANDTSNYKGNMKNSYFGGAPKGDNLFSYRFSEILSAGTIPVVYADDWLLPFNEHVVNWTNCAVVIPESQVNKTREILLAIPDDVRCNMQKCALEVWDRYIADRAGWVRGLVRSAVSTNDVNMIKP